MSIRIGLIIVAAGFFAPYASNGLVPPTFFYWAGALVALRQGKQPQSDCAWKSTARYGLFFHVFANFVGLIIFVIAPPYNMSADFAYYFFHVLAAIAAPATFVGQLIIPYKEITMDNGSIGTHVGFFRGALTGLIDVVICVALGASMSLLRKGRSHMIEDAYDT